MDALKIALLPIKERRKEMNLSLEQMRLIEKDEEKILIKHFERMIHYINIVNQSADMMFEGLVGKTHETINRIENQITVELTKFLKKYFKPNREGTRLYEMMLMYFCEDTENELGYYTRKPYTYNYCLMVNDAVERPKCPCCDYEQMLEEHRVL